jgi:multiple antibiotic resistance protein
LNHNLDISIQFEEGRRSNSAMLATTTSLQAFLTAFIQIAVAVDVLGCIPIYLAMVEGISFERKKSVLQGSLLAGMLIGTIFLFLGRLLLKFLSIGISDFEIAGGLILLLIGVLDLVGEEKIQRTPSETFGIVPLGIPLIVGPATLSVLFLLPDYAGYPITLMAFTANLVTVGFVFFFAEKISHKLGKDGIKAISKVMMLLLIAIGIRMLRMGIIATFCDTTTSTAPN